MSIFTFSISFVLIQFLEIASSNMATVDFHLLLLQLLLKVDTSRVNWVIYQVI